MEEICPKCGRSKQDKNLPCVCDCDIHETMSAMARRAGVSRSLFQWWTEVFSAFHLIKTPKGWPLWHTLTNSFEAGVKRAKEMAAQGRTRQAANLKQFRKKDEGKKWTDVSG